LQAKFIVIVSVLLLHVYSNVLGDEKPNWGWQKQVVGNANMNQTSFDNWAQGGENSFAWQVSINAKFIDTQKSFIWSNTGSFSFGKTRVGKAEARKSVDEIKLESVFKTKLGIEFDPYLSVMCETQTTTGYKYTNGHKIPITGFLDPGYFVESLGFGLKISSDLKTRLGAALKQTVAEQYAEHYTDNPETDRIETFKNEVGINSVSDYRKKLTATSLLISKLELFSNLKGYKEIDVRWDSLLSTKLSSYFNINFNVKLFYDRDISKKRQLKQALALGITYTFL